ncbi:unnamed protein product [Adineta ricciae]|uniref:Uncharacterized protein n=1 Tax=Adineta ricciae TaxID=249248 RepID=A0A814H308_ADIRI|nr:unnamed protein product [Adineta ricciae]
MEDNGQCKQLNNESIRDLADYFDFLAPNEICQHAVGLFFCLIKKKLISISYSDLYQRSLKYNWMDLLVRERRNLKPNINSIEKCLMFNRLIAEYTKNPAEFTQHLTNLYEQLKIRMTSTTIPYTTAEDLYSEVRAYRNLLYQQRLFYIKENKIRQSHTLLSLQQSVTQLCSQLLDSGDICRECISSEQLNQIKELLQHLFVIVAEPSTPECVASTKYEKVNDDYVAKVTTRILCLLDVDTIRRHFNFSSIGVTIYSFDRRTDDDGEVQTALEWKIKRIFDASGNSKSFYYAELQTIRLTKTDGRSSRPFYNSKLCRLRFQLNVTISKLDMTENLTFFSRPFGICSHAQYFPEYVAKLLIYEIEQRFQHVNRLIQPHTITDGVCDYHTRITGVEPQPHTKSFIFQQCQAIYDEKRNIMNVTSNDIYEDILAKVITQLEQYVDHPVLSMMYYDHLFLGICDSAIDQVLSGTREQPHILLRFNTLTNRLLTQQTSVRYLVHNGELIKATFHSKAFVDDMCQMICESISDKAKRSRILSNIPDRRFADFSSYFDQELYRLSSVAPPTRDTYQPLIPVLWSTMRSTDNEQSTQRTTPTSPVLSASSHQDDFSQSNSTSSNQSVNLSSDITSNFREQISFETNKLIQVLLEKLPEMFPPAESNDPTRTSNAVITQRKLCLSSILNKYLIKISQIQTSTQIHSRPDESKSYTFYCSSLTKT